jgi:arsenate reductase-like glutaredoxin family protein
MDSNLKASLTSLHERLAQAGPVDAELQQLLQQLDGDIKTLLERRQHEPQAGDSTTFGLAERTQELSAKFAAKHPQLEPALRELGTILSNIGV